MTQKKSKTTEKENLKVDSNLNPESLNESSNEVSEKKDIEPNYKALYLRALADYKNLENRVVSRDKFLRNVILEEILLKFIHILDNLNQASIFTTDKGLSMIVSLFNKTLESMGLLEIKLEGTSYDPHFAEVVGVVDGEVDDKVIEVLEKAYALNGKCIRPAKVKVSKKIVKN